MKHRLRQIVKASTLVIISSGLTISSANAEWIYKKENKAFGETQAIAMAVGDSSVAFVSCDGDGLKISVATPEDWSDSTSSLNLLSPKIIIAIDGQKPASFDTTLNENGLHKIVAITDEEDVVREAASQISTARKRVDIGVELAGKKFYASRLSAVGAKKIKNVLATCAKKENVEEGESGEAPSKK
jgi:hypothetical protein